MLCSFPIIVWIFSIPECLLYLWVFPVCLFLCPVTIPLHLPLLSLCMFRSRTHTSTPFLTRPDFLDLSVSGSGLQPSSVLCCSSLCSDAGWAQPMSFDRWSVQHL